MDNLPAARQDHLQSIRNNMYFNALFDLGRFSVDVKGSILPVKHYRLFTTDHPVVTGFVNGIIEQMVQDLQ